MTRADLQAFEHVQLALPGMAREPDEDAEVWRNIYAARTVVDLRTCVITDPETGSPPVTKR